MNKYTKRAELYYEKRSYDFMLDGIEFKKIDLNVIKPNPKDNPPFEKW